MKKLLSLAALASLTLIGSVTTADAKIKLHTIGDSTMANYDESSTDKRGWCQMLQQFFDSEQVQVNNRGKSGASSKSFYLESAYWPTLRQGGNDQMQAGDYLLIQFAHNDEKNSGCDGDSVKAYYTSIGDASQASATDYRGTTPYNTYRQYIRHYIDEAKQMGVTPIVVGPICRKYFSGNTIRRNGQHDLGDNFSKLTSTGITTGNKVAEDNDLMDYVAAAREVAGEYADVPFIDLTSLTAQLYLSYGEAYCTSNLFCSDDSTHPKGEGATLIARAFAQQLIDQAASETDAAKRAVLQQLAQSAIVSSEISFNPTSGDMGRAYQGQQIVKEFSVSAFGLEPGTVMNLTTEGAAFQVSTDKVNFATSASLTSEGANLINNIYVRATLTGSGIITGRLTATAGSLTSSIDLSAECISLAGGSEATAVWPLTNSLSPTANELLTLFDESLNELSVKQYGTIGTGDDARTMQLLTTLDGKWGISEIDEVSTRYAEFKVTCPSDYNFAVDRISYYVSGRGGSAVSYHAYYSTNSNFSDAVLIDEKVNMAKDAPTLITYNLAEQLEEGQSIYVRFYPWYNGQSSQATGKYLCLADLEIHGTATNAGGQSISYTGDISYPMVDSDPVFDPEEMTIGFTGKTVSYGNDLTVGGTIGWSGSDGSKNQTKIYNGTSGSFAGSPSASNTILYTLTPEEGLVFLPSRVSLQAARYGTDGGTITAIISGNGEATICESAAINRSGKGLPLTTLTNEVSGVSADAEHPLQLAISVLGLGKTKTVGINDIVIEGTLAGTLQQTTKYSLQVSVNPAGAGVVSIDPQLASYKAGSQVTLKATPAFGFAFDQWQEAGAKIGEDQTLTLTIDSDRSLTAIFDEVPVYTVGTKVTNDQEMSLGNIVLSPNDHEGRYEAGTDIVATAIESKILKFQGWTDSYQNHEVTTASRQLTVEEDMELVANYEVQDFIAVFDASRTQSYAYNTTASYPFGADLTWDDQRAATCAVIRLDNEGLAYSQSTGTPVVRNREGVVLGTINGLYQNGYRTTDIAWQYQFSTEGFTSATFTADMAAKNMASKQWQALISTDGTTFTSLGQWEMTANVAKPISLELPATAMGQSLVTLRITGMGDEMLSTAYAFDKSFDGLDYCDHSESGVGNVYIIGEAVMADDGLAPQIVSTIPVNGSQNVSANGAVTVSYSERIQAGTIAGAALTLSGAGETRTIEPTWNSKSLSFVYANLVYGELYTVYIPEGYVVDRAGNAAAAAEFSFTVMQRTQPQARTFDAIVDGSLTQLAVRDGKIPASADMPAQYRSIQAAIDDAPDAATRPYLIYIKEGYYRDPNYSFSAGYGTRYTDMSPSSTGTATERISGGINEYDSCRIVYVNKPNIHLIGQDQQKVTIATDRFDGSCSDHSRVWYHISAGATLEVMAGGTDFYMEGVTVDNENWTKLQMAGPQSLCMNIAGDRAVLNNVRARSYQDTYYNGGTYNRTFWNNSEIEGSVDFIYGASDVWFEGCTLNINRPSGGFIVAPNHPEGTRWGYVFNNTRITTDDVSDPSRYSIWLGRPWHEQPKTVFLHTQMELTPMDSLWYETMGGLPAIWAVSDFHDRNGYALSEVSRKCYYYKDADGNKVWGTAKNSLTADEVAQYTISNVMSGDGTTSATGYWNPQILVEQTATPQPIVNGTEITWQPVPYAICYVVLANGKAVAFPTDTRYVGNSGDEIVVQSVGENGQLSAPSITVTLSTNSLETIGQDKSAESSHSYDLSGRTASSDTSLRISKGNKSLRIK